MFTWKRRSYYFSHAKADLSDTWPLMFLNSLYIVLCIVLLMLHSVFNFCFSEL